jgi:hypothetical protein
MALYPQPNNWSCGPFALKHALIMLGKFVDEKRAARIAGTHWWSGTDEIKLARAARAYDCRMPGIRETNPLHARRELLYALKRGYPALLCVDNWGHWITVVGAEKGRFIYMDSRKAPVVRYDSWRALKKRWAYHEKYKQDEFYGQTLYDLHPVVPKFRVRSRARFTLNAAKYLRRPENKTFAIYWDEYFGDLLKICQPRTPLSERVISFGEFLRRHEAMIKSQVAFWHGTVHRRHIGKILRNYKFVADTYDLVVRKQDEKHALVALAANLSFWAASKYGVDEVFGGE